MKTLPTKRARTLPKPSAKAARAARRAKLDLRPTLAAARAMLARDGLVTFDQDTLLRQAGDLPARAN
jgi:hypothetical protein